MTAFRTCMGYLLTLTIVLIATGCQTTSDESTAIPVQTDGTYVDVLTDPNALGPLPSTRLRGLDDATNHALANKATREALDKPLTLDHANLTLDMAIAFLRDTTGANIAVNWPALELVGIDADTRLSIQLREVPARAMLQQMLNQVSADAFEDDKAGYAIREGIVVVSTLRDLKRATQTRLYPLDQYANTRPTRNQRIYGRNNSARRMLGMTTLQNKTIDPQNIKVTDLNPGFCANCDASHDRLEVALSVMTYEEKIDQIVDLIQTTVGDPDEWLDEESTLTEINGKLIVKTTLKNHDQIQALFAQMQEEDTQRFRQQALEMEISLLLEAAEAYRLKQDYPAALKKINQALRVDPDNAEARVLHDIVSQTLSR